MFLIPLALKKYNWKKLCGHEGGDKINYEQFENKTNHGGFDPKHCCFLFF